MNNRNGPPAAAYTPETDLTIREQVARYESVGLTHRQACLLTKLDHLREQGNGIMMIVNPAGLTWAFWKVVPDGLIGE